MTVFGITGGSGAGKTTALEALRELGAFVIDCDALYHELLKNDSKLLSDIDGRFPGCVKEGVLDRKALGTIVFADKNALADLNSLTHGRVCREIEGLLAEKRPELAALDAIALIESGLARLCDRTFAVISPADERAARLMLREGISEEYARLRISAQQPDEFFIKNCDFTLENAKMTKNEFKNKASALFEGLLNGGKEHGTEK